MPEDQAIQLEKTQTLDDMLHQVLNQALVAVEAEAGSLMLVNSDHGIMQIKARLGPPRPNRNKEVVFDIRGNSVAAEVVRSKRHYLCPDVEQDKHFAPSRSGRNFNSLLSVPIVHNEEVLAVINADSSKKGFFKDVHVERLERIASQVAAQIANRVGAVAALAEITEALLRSPRDRGVEPVFQLIANQAINSLGADIVTLYVYEQDKDDFPVEGKGPTTAGNIFDPRPMKRKVFKGDVPWTIVKDRRPGFYSKVQEFEFLTGNVEREGDTPRDRFVQREKIKSMAALLLPNRASKVPSEEVVGVMFVNYRSEHDFNIDERTLLATFADYAAAAILGARREERQRAEQMNMVETVNANLAHRMSHLAGPCRHSAQTLANRLPADDQESRALLKDIELTAERLFKVCRILTKQFREGQAAVELIDCHALLDELLTQVSHDHPNVRVVRDIGTSIPKVRSVGFQLHQLLNDVIDNAIEAMDGVVEPTILVRAHYNSIKNCVIVEVTDNGRGIHPDIRERLFLPTASTKKEHLGIGLWWCRVFMRATGGDIRLEKTEPGIGTTFAIDIACPTQAVTSRKSEPQASKDILIVEDNGSYTRNFLLNVKGFSTACAASYAEAVEQLATTRFRLAILDIRLVEDQDNVDGLRVLEEIEKAGLATKVIVMTGHEITGEHQAQCDRATSLPRVVAFYDKLTVSMGEFAEKVREVLAPPN